MISPKHYECERQFMQLSRAWYGKESLKISDYVDEIMIGFYPKGGGTTGEFAIRWIIIGEHIVPQLQSFDDSWSALWEFRDLLEKLAEIDNKKTSPKEICNLLTGLGITDATPTKNPYHKKEK